MRLGSGVKNISTDILVIGAGYAGFFAAIKAKEQGLDVTLTDKAYAGKAGSTHFSEGYEQLFRPERGPNILKEWVNDISQRCEYINNREWDEICLNESKDRHEDVVSWGVQFHEEDGKPKIYSRVMGRGGTSEYVTAQFAKYAPAFRKKALESGVRILDRIVLCELLKQDGRIVGAIGFNTNSGNLYIFKAKATIIATGSSSLKSGSYPVDFWTGDGEAMAYNAGAELANKEFLYHSGWEGGMTGASRAEMKQQEQAGKGPGISGQIYYESYRFPFAIGGDATGWYNSPRLNAEGNPVVYATAWEPHNGRIPLYYDFDSLTPERLEWFREWFMMRGVEEWDKIGLDPLKGGKVKWPAGRIMTTSFYGGGGGIWPINKSCATDVPGLYAAGNSCATLASGAAYGGFGFGSLHAMVTGTRAGLGATEYVSKLKDITLDQTELNRVQDIVCAPMDREGGFSPAWVTQVLHGLTLPYFILSIKHEERLKPTLALLEFVSNHIIPKLKANNAHEWRLALETRNMALIAEMIFRASLFRTESRGSHFREDYPRRDDPTWLAWVKVKNEDGEMKLYKEPVPKEWWPDLSKPYEERYPRAFPLE